MRAGSLRQRSQSSDFDRLPNMLWVLTYRNEQFDFGPVVAEILPTLKLKRRKWSPAMHFKRIAIA